MTNYKSMTIEHLGPEATESDLAEFCGLCVRVQELHPELNDDAVTDAVFGDGDYFANAAKLGVVSYGDLMDYAAGEFIRPATAAEKATSDAEVAAGHPEGLITVDGRTCYVDA